MNITFHWLTLVDYGIKFNHCIFVFITIDVLYNYNQHLKNSNMAEFAETTHNLKKQSKKPHLQNSSKVLSSSSVSTFNWSESNVKKLLTEIPFEIISTKNDSSEPFCHFTHKNLKWRQAPFLGQSFLIILKQLTNVKNIVIDNFTHGSEMTISISDKVDARRFTEVYKEKYVCKGKTLKNETKSIDLGALPCQSILIEIKKGCKISSKNVSLIGVQSYKIEEELGQQYFRLLVINPLRIIYPE